MNNQPPVIFGSGNQTRDFVYIDDLTNIIIKSAAINYEGVVNVGTGRAVSFLKLLDIIKETLGVEVNPKLIEKDKNYIENLRADTGLMKKLFDIEPISVEEGVPKFVNYLRASS